MRESGRCLTVREEMTEILFALGITSSEVKLPVAGFGPFKGKELNHFYAIQLSIPK